jgi:peptide/nickel transport system ATP-binding protein
MNVETPILELRGVSKVFVSGSAFAQMRVRAVENVDLQLYRGRVTALVGESGSGKSTIVRMLARLHDPSGGDILFRGENIQDERGRTALLRYRKRVQMIFQDPFSSLNPVHRVDHHLLRPLKIYGLARGRRQLNEKVLELLNRVKLSPPEEFAAKYPHQLSGGQRQRVAIARALAVEPEVMLADEPVSMLDVSIRIGILNLLDELRSEYNMAVLYVTHDIASARYFAQEIVVMYAGHIVEKAESEELIRNPKHPYTQLLLSAVPDPARGLKTTTTSIKGEISSAANVGVGCPFANRCPHVMDVCRRVVPTSQALDATHSVRCHLYMPESQLYMPESQPAAAR